MFKNVHTFARRHGSKIAVATIAALAGTGAFAAGTDPFTEMMDSVNLTGISVAVIAAGLLIVGIAVSFKSPDVAKRVVRKV